MVAGNTVEEEYKETLRTNSYLDIWERGHQQLKITNSTSSSSVISPSENKNDEGISFAAPLSLRYYARLPDFLLEPSQETLIAATTQGSSHKLVLEYLNATLETCKSCMYLLAGIDRTRTNQRLLTSLLHKDTLGHSVLSELTSHQLDNPLSINNLSHFYRTHALYVPLFRRLAAAHQRFKLQQRFLRCVFNVTCGVLTNTRKMMANVVLQLDAATKGAFVVARDLDTMSLMVRQLHNEVDHNCEMIRMVLRHNEPEVVRVAIREIESKEVKEQLEELEEHVYLCLLNINKSRKMVVEKMGDVVSMSEDD